jgi:hypothetical protein
MGGLLITTRKGDRYMFRVIGLMLGCILFLVLPVAATPDVEATSSASYWSDVGLWEYCFEIYWHDGHGLSHFDVFLGLEGCACVCSPGYFAFADTVGYSTGTTNGDTCTVYWHADFQCYGDPTIPNGDPLIKFEPYENGCEPGTEVTAYVCFYSVAPPTHQDTFPDAIGLKFGQNTEKGDLVGVLPSCDDEASGAASSTWGSVKALYR